MIEYRYIIFLFFFCSPFFIQAQQKSVYLNDFYTRQLEKSARLSESPVHLAVKPLTESKFDMTEVDGYNKDTIPRYYWITSKLFNEHLAEVSGKDYRFTIDPLFNFQVGTDLAESDPDSDNILYTNTRGFMVTGDITNKVSFVTDFRENQSTFPAYYDSIIGVYEVVPGRGRAKGFRGSGYDYSMATGYVSWKPIERVSFQFGHGKNFIGSGYRSLILSDNAFAYSFSRLTSSYWGNRIQYTNLFGGLQYLERLPIGDTPESIYKRKGMGFKYISFRLSKRLEFGFFENIIWKRFDEETGTIPLGILNLNPVIFIGTAILGLDDESNSMIGTNFNWDIFNSSALYGQFILDDPETDKYGYQLGWKQYDIIPALDAQFEFNSVQPYTYTMENRVQGFNHFNQALAHPLGAGFNEIMGIVDYRYKRIIARVKLQFADFDENYTTDAGRFVNFGRNVIIDENSKAQPQDETLPTNLTTQEFRIAYLFNPKTNLQFNVGVINRNYSNDISNQHTQFIYIGLRTNLMNEYYDF